MLYPGISSSDVAVELPFTLMHPKPREEPVHRDSECLSLRDRATSLGVGVGKGNQWGCTEGDSWLLLTLFTGSQR